MLLGIGSCCYFASCEILGGLLSIPFQLSEHLRSPRQLVASHLPWQTRSQEGKWVAACHLGQQRKPLIAGGQKPDAFPLQHHPCGTLDLSSLCWVAGHWQNIAKPCSSAQRGYLLICSWQLVKCQLLVLLLVLAIDLILFKLYKILLFLFNAENVS